VRKTGGSGRPPASLAEGPPARRPQSFLLRHKLAIPVLSVIVFLGVWQMVGSQVSPLTFATPSAVVAALYDLALNGQLLSSFDTAMADFSLGFVIAVLIAIPLGTLLGVSRIAERALNPYINFTQAMPSIAAVPLMVVWFGVGYPARVVTVIWLAILPILINTHAGTRSTPASLRELASIYKLGWFTRIRRIVLPCAMPYIFAGLRRGLGLGLVGMMIAEMDISVNGLGGLVINYGDELRTSYLLGAICISAIVGVITVAVLEIIRRSFFGWIDAVAGRDNA
jgi:NitT/TauT family transport system permease protein